MKIDKKIKNLIFGMFDTMIQGADKYISESSTWLIFTEERRWVIEYTNSKILWFNYHLFQSELNLLGMDCVESKDIIKEWFESRFFGIDVVEETLSTAGKPLRVEDTIQNGVKEVEKGSWFNIICADEVIDNGKKDIYPIYGVSNQKIEETIQNGVKETCVKSFGSFGNAGVIGDIKNGEKEIVVKQSYLGHINDNETMTTTIEFSNKIDDAIENGVKE